MDEQHKDLIGYLNELHDAYDEGKDYARLKTLPDKLKSYASYHFELVWYRYISIPTKQILKKSIKSLKNHTFDFLKKDHCNGKIKTMRSELRPNSGEQI